MSVTFRREAVRMFMRREEDLRREAERYCRMLSEADDPVKRARIQAKLEDRLDSAEEFGILADVFKIV